MAIQVQQIGSRATGSVAASTTVFSPLGNCDMPQVTTEAPTQTTVRTAGIYSNLKTLVSSNDRAGSTLRIRINGANGNSAVAITASTTGEFEDAVNTDTFAAGDEVSTALTTGATGTSFIRQSQTVLFTATSGSCQRLMATNAATNMATASTTFFECAGGSLVLTATTESDKHFTMKSGGTWRNMSVTIAGNARTTNTVIRSRVNGANGNMIVTITSSDNNKIMEDTSNTDTVAADDEINYSLTTGTGTEILTMSVIGTDFLSSGDNFNSLSGRLSQTMNANLTRYLNLGGTTEFRTTESNVQITATIPYTLSMMEVNMIANLVTGDTIFRSRINSANGNQILTFGTAATGIQIDTTNTDAVIEGTIANISAVTPAVGTSVTVGILGMLFTRRVIERVKAHIM